MKLSGRDLFIQMHGEDIKLLHRDLRKLGLTIPDEEADESFFGENTRQVIQELQRKYKLEPTGIVDEATAIAINQELEQRVSPQTFVVKGTIRYPNNTPFTGGLVRAFDKRLRSEGLLGEIVTDQDGSYEITYAPERFRPAKKRCADLMVRVYGEDKEKLAKSPILFHAKPVETLDLVVPHQAEEQSEYERIETCLSARLEGIHPADLKEEDITFLAGQTGLAAHHITLFSAASRLNRQTKSIPAAAFYGLLRQGLPTDLALLAARNSEDLASSLNRSLQDKLIPTSLSGQFGNVVKELQALGQQQFADNVIEVINTSPLELSAACRETFIALRRQHRVLGKEFWDCLCKEAEFTQQAHVVKDLQFTLKLEELTEKNLSLMTAIQKRRRKDGPPTHVLSTLALSDWEALIKQSIDTGGEIPSSVSGETHDERIANYARKLAEATERAFPMVFVAEGIKQGPEIKLPPIHALMAKTSETDIAKSLLADSSLLDSVDEGERGDVVTALEALRREARMFPGLDLKGAMEEARKTGVFRNPIRKGVARFFEEAPDFDLRKTTVDDYISSNKPKLFEDMDVQQQGAIATQLKTLQRVFQVAPRYRQMDALLGEGLDSALSISTLSEDVFVRQFGGALGGEEAARTIHDNARQLTALSTHVFTTVHQAMNDVTPRAMGGNAVSLALNKQLPDWTSLFGRLDLCDCVHCRSVYGPAAYFVDLLQFLNPKALPTGLTKKPIDILLAHRPDLEHIQLTCENTNTTLPYADLVTEVLESYIALGQPRANNTSADITSDALSVNREYGASFPEEISDAAYAKLVEAVFPFSLPFDRSIETIRTYLAHMGSSRYEVIKVFSKTQSESDEACEYLQLSRSERYILLGKLPRQGKLRNFYGYDQEFYGYTIIPDFVPGLLASYFDNVNLAGDPKVVKVGQTVNRDWGTDSPYPDIPADNFSARWTGLVQAPADDFYTFYALTDDGFRLWVDGQLIIDSWKDQSPTEYASAEIRLHSTHEIRVEYYEHLSTAVAQLSWQSRQQPNKGLLEHDNLQVQPWQEHLARVPEFLRRTGLSFNDLLDLLGTRFIHPDPLIPSIALRFYGDSCDLEKATISNLWKNDNAALENIHRFLRLWRKAGGSMSELDQALFALGGKLDEAFLQKFATARQLQADLKTPLAVLLSLWSDLDTHGNGHKAAYGETYGSNSLYSRLFQNKAVFSPLDPDFGLQVDRTEVAGTSKTLDSKATLLLAALRLSAADLAAIRADANLADPVTKLSLRNLSRLHRYAFLARALNLSVPQMLSLKTLSGIDPFKAPADTLNFVDVLRKVQQSGFSIPLLNYLLGNVEDAAATFIQTPASVATVLESLKAGLTKIAGEYVMQTDPTGDPLRRLLSELLVPADVDLAMLIIDGRATKSDDEKRSFIREKLDVLPTQAAETLLLPVDSEADRQERRSFVSVHVLAHLQRLQSRTLIIQSLSNSLGVDEPTVAALVETIVAAQTDPTQRAVADFLALFGADDQIFQSVVRSYDHLHKVALLINTFRMAADELEYLATHGNHFEDLDFNHLPLRGAFPSADEITRLFRQWQRLREVYAVKRSLPAGEKTLFDVFTLASEPAVPLAMIIECLTAATGWNRAELESLCGPDGWNLNATRFVNAGHLERIGSALGLGKRLGVPVAQLISWASSSPDVVQAKNIKETVKAKYDETAWVVAASTLSARLRDMERNALVTYVLQLPAIRGAGMANSNQLFEYFLIDVEMTSCMKTSRIKQAISSVQLFVQRCLLNLEPELPPVAINGDQWQWIKNYRVWEANRKVFLYPENWLEPELRDDKTPFFRELETDLLQSTVTAEVVRDGYLSYLEKLDLISQMEILNMCREEAASSTPELLHVFARTFGVPQVYYYRRRIGEVWMPWEKLDTAIEGNHLMPVVFGSRLLLLWPIFEEITDPSDNSPNNSGVPPKHKWDVRIAWSECKQGKWTGKRVFQEAMRTYTWEYDFALLADKARIYFHTYQMQGLLRRHLHIGMLVWKPGQDDETGGKMVPQAGWTGMTDAWKGSWVNTSVLSWTYLHMPPKSHFSNNALAVSFPPGSVLEALKLPMHNPRGTLPPADNTPDPWQILGAVPSVWRIVTLQNKLGIAMETNDPFFYQDHDRTYYVTTIGGPAAPVLRFTLHFHPHCNDFIAILNGKGISELLSLRTQKLGNTAFGNNVFFQEYAPTELVDSRYPVENVEFGYGGAYTTYNYELFFHAPIFIADRLSKGQRFAEAQRWFHYVFDPVTDEAEPAPQRYWRFLPFHESTEEQRIQKLLQALANPDGAPELRLEVRRQIEDWRNHPFEPHRIARMRLSAYQKQVVMKYIDNLITWGDHLYAQDTIESINEATQLYVLAANILGPRPERIPELAIPVAKTFAELKDTLDEFSNALTEVQNRFPFVATIPPSPGNGAGSAIANGFGLGRSLYFGIPRNEKLLRYWDVVDDRLFKIRHCMNVEGIQRTLPLFEPPIEPGLLVRARAAGLDVGSALSDLNAPLGYYRFSYMLPKALELCAEVKALGGALLSALEKRDAEALSILRQQHETTMLQQVRQVKERQVFEARTALEALQKTRAVTDTRYSYYKSLEYTNAREDEYLQRSDEAQKFQRLSQLAELAVAVQALLPNATVGASGAASSPVVTFQWGGANLSSALQGFSRAMSYLGSQETDKANRAMLLGGWDRRSDEWRFQEDVAAKELEQIDLQILGAEIRIAVAEHEIRNHDRQIENAETVERFMQDKYTNQELYNWMAGQISGLFFQSYQMAYGLAKRTEQTYRYELGLKASNFIQFGYWDSLKKGLLAGERLYHDLKRMEIAYLDQNKREYEITKHISLRHINPIALIQLKETGKCKIRLPEELFDLDFPGHYFRRIRSVSITVPCVVGPYSSVNCTLTLLSNETRVSSLVSDGYPKRADGEDDRFVTNFTAAQSIATSQAQNDSGLFELNFRDERYLPFEGAGAVSTWQLELPADVRQFDYDTISDVVLHLKYSAREGGALLRDAAVGHLKARIDEAQAVGMVRLFSVRHEFPSEWARFKSAQINTGQFAELTLEFRTEHYSYWMQNRLEALKSLGLIAKTTKEIEIAEKADGTGKKDKLLKSAELGDLRAGNLTNIPLPTPTGKFSIHFSDNSMDELWVLCTVGGS